MKRFLALTIALLLLLAGCGGSDAPAAPVDLEQLYDSFVPTLPEMLVLDRDMMLNYCGVDADLCVQAVVAVCADSLRADEIWLLEAADASALKTLKAAADERLNTKAEESESYSPEQYAVVQDAQVITAGNYLVVIVSPDAPALAELFRQAAWPE